MKTLLALLALSLSLAFLPSARATRQEDPATLLKELAWMEGRWVRQDGGQYLEETWSPAREDAMVGMFRWARKGEVWLYELMSIEADEEHGLVFRLRHFDRNLKPWAAEREGPLTYPLENFEEHRVVFENRERDHPRRFVYQRKDRELHIRLEGPDGTTDSPFVLRLDD